MAEWKIMSPMPVESDTRKLEARARVCAGVERERDRRRETKNVLIMVMPCACTKSLQLCPTLCDPLDCSLPVSSVHGILQARILEWVAMSSSRGSS